MTAPEAANETGAASGVGAKAAFLKKAEREIASAASQSAARRKCNKALRKAILAFQKSDHAKAAMLAVDATEADPSCGQAYHMLALALDNMGEIARALPIYEKAFQLDPSDTDLYLNLGLAAWRIGMNEVAEKFFRLYCEMEPDQPMGWNNLAGVLRDLSRFDEAIDICRSAIYRMPEQPLLWNTLGTILVEMSDFAQATTFYREALRLDPRFGRAWHNLGYGLHHTGPLDEAMQAYERALELSASPADRLETRYAQGLGLLCMGRLAEGFAAYETRHDQMRRNAVIYGIDAPFWQGEDLTGKTLLAIGEQGLGDEVMFANTLPDLQRAVGPEGRLLVAVDDRLGALFRRSFPEAEIGNYYIFKHNARDLRRVPWADKPDYVAPFGNTLTYLRRSLDDFHGRAFLKADPERVRTYDARLAERPGLRVGVCWRSMLINAQRRKYFSAIDMWRPIFTTPGVSFVNLQYGDAAEEMERARKLFGVDILSVEGLDLKNDLDGAAALSAACDIVISAPTAAAALAGAVGTEVWFLAAGHGWPQLGTTHYPWYPASRVYAPAAFADWDEAIGALSVDLAARAAQAAAVSSMP